VSGEELTVIDAVRRDLAALGDDELAQSGLAATALALARSIDNSRTSATARSMCAKALAENLDRLRELAPEKKTDDAVDELAARRAARRGAPAA
jgi:hypothetical protein